MAKKPAGPTEKPSLTRPRGPASDAIEKQIAEGEELAETATETEAAVEELNAKVDIWKNYSKELLRTLFTTSELAENFEAAAWRTLSLYSEWPEEGEFTREQVRRGITNLTSVLRRLELYDAPEAKLSGPATSSPNSTVLPDRSVFLVHGRDDGAKQAVARFLERLDLDVTILHEKPNAGRTIIEKFEKHANVGFAVVLLTPDDVGHLRDQPKEARPRARQNVVLELGYFIGKLSRTRVVALHLGDVELPSDLDGLLYVPMDAGGAWQLKLAAEVKAAGVDVDMNKAL